MSVTPCRHRPRSLILRREAGTFRHDLGRQISSSQALNASRSARHPGDPVNGLAYSVHNYCTGRGSVIAHLEGLERRGQRGPQPIGTFGSIRRSSGEQVCNARIQIKTAIGVLAASGLALGASIALPGLAGAAPSPCGATHGAFANVNGNFGGLGADNGAGAQSIGGGVPVPGSAGYNNSTASAAVCAP